MNIYTRTGDGGTTGLIGGERVSKGDLRIECIGTVDELNAAIGLAAVTADVALAEQLRAIQSELFVLGSHLAMPHMEAAGMILPPFEEALVARLEQQIDAADQQLPRLQQFILPGGTESAARLHVARTICRRAERLLVRLAAEQAVPAVVVVYLNRLADWLFVAARLANHRQNVPDVPWRR